MTTRRGRPNHHHDERHTTHLRPHEQLLVGQITGGIISTTQRCWEEQGSRSGATRNGADGGVEWRVAWAALVIGNNRGMGSGNDGSAGKLECVLVVEMVLCRLVSYSTISIYVFYYYNYCFLCLMCLIPY
jgi:hypothetical protein